MFLDEKLLKIGRRVVKTDAQKQSQVDSMINSCFVDISKKINPNKEKELKANPKVVNAQFQRAHNTWKIVTKQLLSEGTNLPITEDTFKEHVQKQPTLRNIKLN